VPNSFTHFLARSLVLFEDELPALYREIARRVGVREVRCHVDFDRVTIFSDGRRLHLSRRVEAPVVQLSTSRQVIVDLVHAKATLKDALWDDRILLRGNLDDLLAFHDGLMAYLQGSVRCPSFPELLEQYLEVDSARQAEASEVPNASAPAAPVSVPFRGAA
jgi:hypothetical protein